MAGTWFIALIRTVSMILVVLAMASLATGVANANPSVRAVKTSSTKTFEVLIVSMV